MLFVNMKILVADDSKPIRERLVARLSALDKVKVQEAVNTSEALRKIHEFHPDIAVLDIRMPGGGGIKVLTAIKKDFPDVTVIIMTNYPYAQYRRKCMNAGADFFFDKSNEFEQVPVVVQQLLAGEDVRSIAHRTAAAQLTETKEHLERIEQKRQDMGILSLLRGGGTRRADDNVYAMWEKTFDAIPDMVAVFDATHRIVRANKAMADRLNVPAAEMTGRHCYEYIHGTSCPVVGCPHEQMLEDLKEHVTELYDDNLRSWLSVSVTPVLQNGELIGAVHIARDITERKLAEEAVRRSESELRYVMDSTSEGIWDWDILNDVVTCSPQWYEMLGFRPEEFPVDYSAFEKRIHPDDLQKVEESLRAYFCGESERYSVEMRFRRKDGTYAWIWARGSLLARTPDGEPARMMGTHSDMSAARRAEKALIESETRYRKLFDSMHAAFALHEIILDDAGKPCDYRFLEVNPAFEELTGLKGAHVVGCRVKEILPTIEEHWIQTYGEVALSGRPTRLENYAGSLDRYFAVSAYSPRKGQFATIFYDVTDQKKAHNAIQEALKVAEESSRIKTQFLANMSHELRTPLNAIIGLNELLAETELDDQQRDYVETIGTSGESLLKIISDLFDLSRLEMGKIDVVKEPFDPRELAEQALSLLRNAAGKKGLALHLQVDDDVPEKITADSGRVQQVLVNLLNNAVKFTDTGFVKLRVGIFSTPAGSRRCIFTVEDNGSGMDEEMLDRVFDPFQQGDPSITREHGGAGLGLAISRNLAELMGGTLTVKSSVGNGSRFTLSIPQPFVQQQPDIALLHSIWKGRRVCVWHNNPADLHVLDHVFERCGLQVCYTGSVDDMCACANHKDSSDMVLIGLDEIPQATVLREISQLNPDVIRVGLSDWSQPLSEADRAVFHGFLDRPVVAAQILCLLAGLTPESDGCKGVQHAG